MANPIGPEPAACRKPPGALGLVEMRHHDAVLAGVAGDDRVLRQVAHQFADDPLRQDRLVVGEIGRRVEIAVLLAMRARPAASPPRAARRRRASRTASRSCAQDLRRVAEQHVLGREVPRGVARLDVDLDESSAASGRAASRFSQAVSLGRSFEPTTRTRSASPMQAFAAAVPNVPNTPSASGWVSAKQPLPAAVVATGSPAASASARSCS